MSPFLSNDGISESKLVTEAALRSQKSKELAQLAKTKGVAGWHSMRKEQLVHALIQIASAKSKSKSTSIGRPRPSAVPSDRSNTVRLKPTVQHDSKIARKLRKDRQRADSLKNLALVNERDPSNTSPNRDRVILIVRDPYWIQAYWEITRTTAERVRVALSDQWYETSPVLRLLEISSATSVTSTETVVKQIAIHGGVRNWFIDVSDPPQSYRVALGYATASGKFHLIAKSNLVTTPTPDSEAFDHNWSDIQTDHRKYYAMSGGYGTNESHESTTELQSIFEEKLRRPMNIPAFVRMGNGINTENDSFDFEVEAHMVVYGQASPDANVTLAGEPVELRTDGSFSVRLEMPDKRQVLPIIASSRDGTQKRTTVLAVERNTKVMEPVTKQMDEF